MKAILILMGLMGAAVLGLYYGGGYATLDPTKQGEDARKAITAGMSWKQVVDTTQAPRKYIRMIEEQTQYGVSIKPGMGKPFDAGELQDLIKRGGLPHGFIFKYKYSGDCEFEVMFDDTGTVEGVNDLATVADLYNGQLPGGLPTGP